MGFAEFLVQSGKETFWSWSRLTFFIMLSLAQAIDSKRKLYRSIAKSNRLAEERKSQLDEIALKQQTRKQYASVNWRRVEKEECSALDWKRWSSGFSKETQWGTKRCKLENLGTSPQNRTDFWSIVPAKIGQLILFCRTAEIRPAMQGTERWAYSWKKKILRSE